ncbi:MAG TPA: SMC-Scp complex subunit ScpB [Rhodospirillaceae bacterium]|nr:SMC-Scp complex subunit ScpB [Rhodospirillaceae bacterium]|tara:strand:- start:80 stop:790 length:711 start_codon:yes stop_codon:yes gene_type:complete
MSDINRDHLRLLEAVLFASEAAMTERVLANRLPDDADLKALLKELQDEYAGRGVNLVHVGGSWAFRTAEDLAAQMTKHIEITRKLSRAAIETLAIVAYHQPITRAEIEEIRGVSLSKGTMDILLEEGWIKPRGRKDAPGRPLTWGTTDGFLDHFGLENLRDLPGIKELKAMGLLESGPALNVYRSSGELGEDGAAEDEDESDEVTGDQAPPPGGADITEDDSEEALDPDDGLQSAG